MNAHVSMLYSFTTIIYFCWFFFQENLQVEKTEFSKKFKKKIPEIEKIAEAKREKIEKQKEQESIKVEKISEKLIATPNAYPPNTKTCGCF